MDRLTLPLEVGKKYVCRDGQVRVARPIGGIAMESIMALGDAYVYTKTGIVGGHRDHSMDAVADYVEPAKGHPHAALMALYAQDAAETDKPWERWEVRSPGHGSWAGFIGDPTWDTRVQYRRKPKTIRIGEHDVPEPMRAAPMLGKEYYVPVLGQAGSEVYRWRHDEVDQWYLTIGLVHDTREAADAHAKALVSLTAAP